MQEIEQWILELLYMWRWQTKPQTIVTARHMTQVPIQLKNLIFQQMDWENRRYLSENQIYNVNIYVKAKY